MKVLLCIYNISSISEKRIDSFVGFLNDLRHSHSLTLLQPILDNKAQNAFFSNKLYGNIDIKGINLYVDTYNYFKKCSFDYAVNENYSHCIFLDNQNIDEGLLQSYLANDLSFDNQKREDLKASGKLFPKLISMFMDKKFVTLFTNEIIALPTITIEKLPYKLLDNGSRFDIEFGFQLSLLEADTDEVLYTARKEQPISFQYFLRFLSEWFKLFFSNRGIVFQPKYDVEKTNAHYPLKLGYTSSHTMALNALEGATSVLDIGSGPIPISYELKGQDIDIATVDLHPPTNRNPKYKHIIQDLNRPLSVDASEYQTILLLDIIEHLHNPELFLKNLNEQFKTDGHKIICTTGNIAFLPMRMTLLLGKFNYGKRGILDRTHTRLYTFFTFRDLLTRSGMTITKIKGIPVPFPLALGDNSFARFLVKVNEFLIFFSKSIFSFQIYIEATSQPSMQSQIVDIKVKEPQ